MTLFITQASSNGNRKRNGRRKKHSRQRFGGGSAVLNGPMKYKTCMKTSENVCAAFQLPTSASGWIFKAFIPQLTRHKSPVKSSEAYYSGLYSTCVDLKLLNKNLASREAVSHNVETYKTRTASSLL
jgi:hypothetical protein